VTQQLEMMTETKDSQSDDEDWLQEAYELSDVLVSNAVKVRAKSKHKPKSSRNSPR